MIHLIIMSSQAWLTAAFILSPAADDTLPSTETCARGECRIIATPGLGIHSSGRTESFWRQDQQHETVRSATCSFHLCRTCCERRACRTTLRWRRRSIWQTIIRTGFSPGAALSHAGRRAEGTLGLPCCGFTGRHRTPSACLMTPGISAASAGPSSIRRLRAASRLAPQ